MSNRLPTRILLSLSDRSGLVAVRQVQTPLAEETISRSLLNSSLTLFAKQFPESTLALPARSRPCRLRPLQQHRVPASFYKIFPFQTLAQYYPSPNAYTVHVGSSIRTKLLLRVFTPFMHTFARALKERAGFYNKSEPISTAHAQLATQG